MIDYLELTAGEEADALLERMRQSERSWSGRDGEGKAQGTTVVRTERQVEEQGTKTQTELQELETEREDHLTWSGCTERETEGALLLAQLDRLERAVWRGAGTAAAGHSSWLEEADANGRRMKNIGPVVGNRARGFSSMTEIGRSTGAVSWPDFERPGPLPGDELRWAEQADRVFRRDSRRYDAGFHLY